MPVIERGSRRAATIGRWGVALTLVIGAVLFGRLIRAVPYLLPNRLPGLVLYELAPGMILALAIGAALAITRGFLHGPHDGRDDRQLQDRFHRLAIALELALKSYLAFRGHSDDDNRRIGHDLRRAATIAEAQGLSIPPALARLIDDTHPFFMQGGSTVSGAPIGVGTAPIEPQPP